MIHSVESLACFHDCTLFVYSYHVNKLLTNKTRVVSVKERLSPSSVVVSSMLDLPCVIYWMYNYFKYSRTCLERTPSVVSTCTMRTRLNVFEGEGGPYAMQWEIAHHATMVQGNGWGGGWRAGGGGVPSYRKAIFFLSAFSFYWSNQRRSCAPEVLSP